MDDRFLAKARYRLTKAADFDLELIWKYTHEEWGVGQASKYLRQLKRTIEKVAKQPKHGKRRDELSEGLRSVLQGRHLIFYRTGRSSTDTVIRVLHDRMDVPTQLSDRSRGVNDDL